MPFSEKRIETDNSMSADKLKEKNLDEETQETQASRLEQYWDKLLRLGLGESAMRVATAITSLALFIVIIWVMGRFYSNGHASSASEAGVLLTPTATIAAPPFPGSETVDSALGILQLASLHTILPSLERYEVVTYTVEKGETLFSIAEKFGLQPESILWGNRYTLGDDPHAIYPGQELNILPLDGVFHKWSAGEGMNGVASFYKVAPEDIINFPGNGLDPATIGDYMNPNIEAGTLLVIPGGKGVFTDWRTPRIPRDDPAVAKHVGAGACTGSYEGITGTLNFLWPTTERYLSGYDYSPSTNHFGIDIAGKLGNPIFAADSGVVVYAGWNDWGYGEMIVVDHGFGWQTLYAHLSQIHVGCGQEVYQGDTIGLMGSTGNSSGPHLHFEMRNDEYGRVNPWDFLQ